MGSEDEMDVQLLAWANACAGWRGPGAAAGCRGPMQAEARIAAESLIPVELVDTQADAAVRASMPARLVLEPKRIRPSGPGSADHRLAVEPPTRRPRDAEADFHHQPRRVRRHFAHMEAEWILDKAEARLAGERDWALLAVDVQKPPGRNGRPGASTDADA